MNSFLNKVLGRSDAARGKQAKDLKFDDVTAWMAGEADEATRQKIAAELQVPDSPINRHLAKQAGLRQHDSDKTGRNR